MRHLFIAITIAATALSSAAMAGKADGILRMAYSDPIELIDEVFDPKGETGFTSRSVNASLVRYDPTAGEYIGEAAESWSLIDDTTLEFKLRPGIVFQDGSALTADDVAYTINFVTNPDIRFRLKTRWGQLAGAEAIDDLTVHIKTKKVYIPIMARLAATPIWPSDAHSALEDPSTWGKAPIGAGEYRAVQVDSDKGIILERWDDYALGPVPEVKTIEIRPIPDEQSQIAEMMVGGIDVAAMNQADLIASVTAAPNITSTVSSDLGFLYMLVDAADRSGIGVFTDQRVRQAVFHAVDTDTIRKQVVAASDRARAITRVCFEGQIACPDGGSKPDYDPAKAKALLAEAGLADGFDVTITTVTHVAKVAEAVAGYLRDVGIRASVDSNTMGGYRKKQGQGKINILIQHYSHGGSSDASNALEFYYASKARDYAVDGELKALVAEGFSTIDPAVRADVTRKAYDLIAERNYLMPISGNPAVFVHSTDVEIDTSNLGAMWVPYGLTAASLGWAD